LFAQGNLIHVLDMEGNNTIVLRKVYAVNSNTGLFLSTGQILVTDGKGGTEWQPIISSIRVTGGPEVGILPSTISTISTTLFLTQTTIAEVQYALSTNFPGGITSGNLISTTAGLGSADYVSSSALLSTTIGLTNTLGTSGYISSQTLETSLRSTVIGLGSAGYISSTNGLNFSSTLNGLGSAGYISTASLQSSLVGLGTFGYISTTSLFSSIAGLGQLDYISNPTLALNLTSSVKSLGTQGYVSSGSLVSTTVALSSLIRNIRFDNAGSVFINDSQVTFTNAENAIYISSFRLSSIQTFGATNIGARVSNNSNLIFSSASFSLSSLRPYIQSTSRISVDFTPNFAFSRLAGSATGPAVLPISTFLQYNTTTFSTLTTNYLFAWAQSSVLGMSATPWPNSNFFQVPIHIELPPSTINEFSTNVTLLHMIPGGLTFGGYVQALADSNLTSYLASPGSLYVSVENVPR
jgi:hypothetical protein